MMVPPLSPSPAWDDILRAFQVPSPAGLSVHTAFLYRRLKPTVNKMLSLRDM
jgi:hypothetical protein